MFCGKCGTQNLNDARFCKECGAPLNNIPSTPTASETIQANQSAGKRNRTIGIIAVAVVVLTVLIIAISLLRGRSYASTVNKFIEASLTADGKTIVSLVPDEVVKLVCEDEDMTKSEFTEYLTEELADALESYYSYFDEWNYSYKIIETEDYSSKALKLLKENYEDEFDVTIKAAKTVTVKVTITADEDNEVSNSLKIEVVQVGNSWYVDVPGMGGLI